MKNQTTLDQMMKIEDKKTAMEAITPTISECKPLTYIVTADGYAVDDNTGEVLGMTDEHGILIIETKDEKPLFIIDTMHKADWVLEKILNSECNENALALKLAAITDNIKAQIKDEQRRQEYLHARFDNDLKFFARVELSGSKAKSLKTTYATLAFRATPVRIKIVSMEAALTWAEQNAEDAIKTTKEVPVSYLKGREDLPVLAFETIPAGENFSIKTGAK